MNKAALAENAVTPSGDIESPPNFKFSSEGEELFGRVRRTVFGLKTTYGDADLIEIEDEDRGLVTLWLDNVQLHNAFVKGSNPLERTIQEDDTVYIRFDGVKRLENGNQMKNYSVNLVGNEENGEIPESF